MIDSVSLTRKGWIKHIGLVQKMLDHIGNIYVNCDRAFATADCEEERSAKIVKEILKLKELIWETGAVSERINREKRSASTDIDGYDAHPQDPFNHHKMRKLKSLYASAKDLEKLSRSIYNKKSDESDNSEVSYPGEMNKPDGPVEDPRQMNLGLKPAEPPVVDITKIVDVKARQANDDTGDASDE